MDRKLNCFFCGEARETQLMFNEYHCQECIDEILQLEDQYDNQEGELNEIRNYHAR